MNLPYVLHRKNIPINFKFNETKTKIESKKNTGVQNISVVNLAIIHLPVASKYNLYFKRKPEMHNSSRTY